MDSLQTLVSPLSTNLRGSTFHFDDETILNQLLFEGSDLESCPGVDVLSHSVPTPLSAVVALHLKVFVLKRLHEGTLRQIERLIVSCQIPDAHIGFPGFFNESSGTNFTVGENPQVNGTRYSDRQYHWNGHV